MSTTRQLKKDLNKLADKKRAEASKWFFKTGKGEYGEGDVFIGVTVPEQRKVAKRNRDLSLDDIQKLLDSKIHEYRLTALFILVGQFKNTGQSKPSSAKAEEGHRQEIFDFYLRNTKNINNWDLVDSSANKIVGEYLLDRSARPRASREILYKLVNSESLWERRIAIIATAAFIKESDFKDTLKISKILLKDNHDLIHKAVGWMLREVGNRDLAIEEKFLKKHYKQMPRTMLRYAIEKFPEKKRQHYLKK